MSSIQDDRRSIYGEVRDIISQSGEDAKVEVNQRALIDKILARYATPGAVYRELLQNSNDANATECEIRFTTKNIDGKNLVTEVVYRNNGMPFRNQDWSRLKKIAEGNPDPNKVGFFGVGAYAMFSICEAPLIISGDEALVFVWKGDALWSKVGKSQRESSIWTSFVLPARDPYPYPNIVEFGDFIFGNLTFLNSISSVSVFKDELKVLELTRKVVSQPEVVIPPTSSSWWNRDGAILKSPQGYFMLVNKAGSITESTVRVSSKIGNDVAYAETRLLSAIADANVPNNMKIKIERVTKKVPPKTVLLQIVLGNSIIEDVSNTIFSQENFDTCKHIVSSFSPNLGSGKIFIGFKTSQTTGLGIHFAAPLIPTVEREAIDLIDPTLQKYNSELLYVGGILMRLALEHNMLDIDNLWKQESDERAKRNEIKRRKMEDKELNRINQSSKSSGTSNDLGLQSISDVVNNGSFTGFARFMASGMKRISAIAVNSEFRPKSEDNDLLNPLDDEPLTQAETSAVALMRCFAPEKSTPEFRVGQWIAKGFEECMYKLAPPVLTTTGVCRGIDAYLPSFGMEYFVHNNLVRKAVLNNTEEYLIRVAQVPKITFINLVRSLDSYVLDLFELVRLIRWWVAFSVNHISTAQLQQASTLLKRNVKFTLKKSTRNESEVSENLYYLQHFSYYTSEKYVPYDVALPESVFPRAISKFIPAYVFEDKSMVYWFSPITFTIWLGFISRHQSMSESLKYPKDNLKNWIYIQQELLKYRGTNRAKFESNLKSSLSNISCIPYDESKNFPSLLPGDLYLPSTELGIFSEADMRKVSGTLIENGISEELMKAVGVRETVSMEVLFSQINTLKWNENPQPLVSFLRKSVLGDSDLHKLRTSKYLPSSGNDSELFSPSDLCFPTKVLTDLKFVRLLQWPENSDISEKTPDGRFLQSIGCKVVPPLEVVLKQLNTMSTAENEPDRDKLLDFLSDNTGRRGKYEKEFNDRRKYSDLTFIPCYSRVKIGMESSETFSLRSINSCFLEPGSKILGFYIVQEKHKMIAQRFGVRSHPSWNELSEHLISCKNYCKSSKSLSSQIILNHFKNIFSYLSTQTSSIQENSRMKLRSEFLIPVVYKKDDATDESISWKTSSQVFFQTKSRGQNDNFVENLFHFVEESTFLRFIGVKEEPGAEEICYLISKNPQNVLDKCGHANYKSLLKRLSSHFNEISRDAVRALKDSKCLIAMKFDESLSSNDAGVQQESEVDEVQQNVLVVLEKAQNICVVDDGSLQRIFNPLCCPSESDIEELYVSLGSQYISKLVRKYHETYGTPRTDTPATSLLKKRLRERAPLLIAPNITHRPLLGNAVSLLDPKNIEVFEVDRIKACYILDSKRSFQYVTCCSSKTTSNLSAVTQKPLTFLICPEVDFFDIGKTICDIILKRSHLEDAFLFGTLLEAPLSQLRSRGFPVDRVVKARVQPQPKLGPSKINPVPQEDDPVLHKPKQENSIISREEGYLTILSNKFPDCRPEHIIRLLKEDNSKDKLLNVSKILDKGAYPTKTGAIAPQGSRTSIGSSNPFKSNSAFSKAMKGIFPKISTPSKSSQPFPQEPSPRPNSSQNRKKTADENESQMNLENSLKRAINTSSSVGSSGIKTNERKAPILPDIEQSATCEIVDGKDLIPSPGPYGHNKTKNGTHVFAANRGEMPVNFLKITKNWESIERFSIVIEQLTQVFSLNPKSVAIYYDPEGNTIAFNAGNALYFNSRYYIKLHDNSNFIITMPTMSYWFVVFCHELAHNLQKNHGKEHGYYTESFCQKYQPILFERMSKLGVHK